MYSKPSSVPKKSRRLPRKGCLFLLVRIAGVLLMAAGLLLLGMGLIGFFVMLVRIGPTIVDSIQYIDQQMGGFVFLLAMTNLLIFPFLGLVGAVIAAAGFGLGYIGTQPKPSTAASRPDPEQINAFEDPPTRGAN